MTIQSGILSAFGMCPETKFRKVPLTGDQVGIVGTNPMRFFTIEPDGGFPAKPDITVPNDEIDGSASLKRTILGAKDYDGRQSYKADAENMLIPRLGVFGKVTNLTVTPLLEERSNGNGNGGTKAYGTTEPGPAPRATGTTATTSATTGDPQPGHAVKHVFTMGGNKPSFTAEEIFGLHKYGRLSSGVIVPRLDTTLGRLIMETFTATPYRQIPNRYINNAGADTDYDWRDVDGPLPAAMQDGVENTMAKITAVPNYVDVTPDACGDGPFVHARIVHGSETGFSNVFFKLNGVTDLDFKVPEGSTISRYFDAEAHHIMGSGYDPGATNANAFHVEGKFDVLFEDNSIILNTLAKCYFSVNFKVLGILIGGTTRYSWEVYIPRFRFLSSETTTPARAMMTGGNFVAEVDPALGYEIKETLINTTDISTWGGEVGDNPGGLGGFELSATPPP